MRYASHANIIMICISQETKIRKNIKDQINDGISFLVYHMIVVEPLAPVLIVSHKDLVEW